MTFLLLISALLLILAILAAIGDEWERRDARQRNHVRRRRW